MENVVYGADVTEYESGWGQRHDGYVLALDKESFEKTAKDINNYGNYECFSRVGSPRLLKVTPKMYEEIKAREDKSIWTGENSKNWYIEG